MFRGDDDDDFTLGSSSKLASLFGAEKSSQEGNTSLTYTAPKQPKQGHVGNQSVKGQAFGQAGGQTTSSPSKLSIITVKAVHTYKLTDGNYNAQGKLGAAVLGNAVSRVYQLLLYKGKQQRVTSARISPSFQFVVQANNYATFYDDEIQNWSVMFDTSNDAIEFAKEVGLARSNAAGDQGEPSFMTQDLLSGIGSAAAEGDTVDVRYIAFSLTAGRLGEEVENTVELDKPWRVKLKLGSWEEGLIGVAKGCKRIIILPPTLVGPWKGRVPADVGVMLEIDIGRIKSANRTSRTDSGDSSADDTSIRARGASISESLCNSPKTRKVNIISRVARMGQATLPMKGAIVCEPSDSEEVERTDDPLLLLQGQEQLYPLVAQPAVSSQQVFPLLPTAISTPPDCHVSVFLAEVRMGMVKVADKLDQVLKKLNDMQHGQSAPTMEPSALLMGIQKLICDNEQRQRIELQNEKLYQLLQSNQKYLEQCHDTPLQTLQHEKAKLGTDLSEALSRISTLEVQVANAGKEMAKMQSSQDEQQETQAYSKSAADLQGYQLILSHQEGSPSAPAPNVVDEVKKVMNMVYRTLHPQFVPDELYDGLKIRQTIKSIIRDVTLKYTAKNINDAANGIHTPVVPAVETESAVSPASELVASGMEASIGAAVLDTTAMATNSVGQCR